MVIKILCYLFLLVVATWAGLQLSQQPGYILISYNNINVETSLWFGVLAVIALFITLYLALSLLRSIWRAAANCSTWLCTTSEHKKLELAVAAITAATYENWPMAEKALQKYAASSDFIAFMLLAIIKSKHDMGASIALLEKLYLEYPKHSKFILLIKAYIYFSNNQYNDAICAIESLNAKERSTDAFSYILFKCYYKLGSYTKVKDLLPKCSKLLTTTEYDEIALYYYKEQLKNATATELTAAWKKTPEQFKREPECLTIYVGALLGEGDKAAAQKILLKYIPYSWQLPLLRKYIELTPKSTAIIQLTRWHEQHAEEPSLLLVLAELHHEHTALATSFYQKALAIGPNKDVLFAAISYFLENNNTSAATKLLKTL